MQKKRRRKPIFRGFICEFYILIDREISSAWLNLLKSLYVVLLWTEAIEGKG